MTGKELPVTKTK